MRTDLRRDVSMPPTVGEALSPDVFDRTGRRLDDPGGQSTALAVSDGASDPWPAAEGVAARGIRS